MTWLFWGLMHRHGCEHASVLREPSRVCFHNSEFLNYSIIIHEEQDSPEASWNTGVFYKLFFSLRKLKRSLKAPSPLAWHFPGNLSRNVNHHIIYSMKTSSFFLLSFKFSLIYLSIIYLSVIYLSICWSSIHVGNIPKQGPTPEPWQREVEP